MCAAAVFSCWHPNTELSCHYSFTLYSCMADCDLFCVCTIGGVVQAWVAHFASPLKRRDNESDWWVMSQKAHKIHNLPNKHHHYSMVVKPPTPLAAWIWWIHAAPGVGGLVHTFSVATIKRLCLIHYINVAINLFSSTSMSMFNRILARPPATMVAKSAAIVVVRGR